MDRERVREAIELLIKTDNFAVVRAKLIELVTSKSPIKLRFSGEFSPLNALIDLYSNSEASFAAAMNLVAAKREAVPATARTDYQRDYMRQQRARLGLAVKIENRERGIKLTGEAREAFKKQMLAKWMKARDAYIRDRGELTWKERNLAAAEFWRQIDSQLELRYYGK